MTDTTMVLQLAGTPRGAARSHTGAVASSAPWAVARTGSRSARRDEEFSEYLRARQPQLLRTAYLLTGDRYQAEDVLQTSLAKLYLAWDRVQDRGSVDAYVRRIIVNENNSLWRRPWKRREHPTEVLPDGGSDHTHSHVDTYDDGTSAALWEVVQALPRRARAVVVLRYYEQLTEAETADVLGISVGTVKSQCSRAIAAMRRRVPAHLHPSYSGDGPADSRSHDGSDETEEDAR